MNKVIEDAYAKAAEFHETYDDQQLYDFILQLIGRLEDADMMKHQFNYLLLHARKTVAYPVRTRHFQEALERADRFLSRLEDSETRGLEPPPDDAAPDNAAIAQG